MRWALHKEPQLNTTESQITSGKTESIEIDATFNGLLADYRTGWAEGYQAIIAHIEAVREKDREEAYAAGRRNGARDERSQSKAEAEEAAALAAVLPNGAAVTNVYDAYSEGLKQAERDHFKAIAERQAADLRAAIEGLTDFAPDKRAQPDGMTRGGPYIRKADVISILSPAQQEPAKDVWADGINPAHVAAYDTALKEY